MGIHTRYSACGPGRSWTAHWATSMSGTHIVHILTPYMIPAQIHAEPIRRFVCVAHNCDSQGCALAERWRSSKCIFMWNFLREPSFSSGILVGMSFLRGPPMVHTSPISAHAALWTPAKSPGFFCRWMCIQILWCSWPWSRRLPDHRKRLSKDTVPVCQLGLTTGPCLECCWSSNSESFSLN